ncbi:MAG TPA: ATP-dependent zinc metalloprotease FtsH [Planctomycetota bacterium]|nr:ATP-dependent zinc metalloprotease FtsH [Planctomycetota bacterium]
MTGENGTQQERRPPRAPSLEDPRKRNSVLITYTLVAITIFLAVLVVKGQSRYVRISYTEFRRLVDKMQPGTDQSIVKKAVVSEDEVTAELAQPESVTVLETPPRQETTTAVATTLGFKVDQKFLDELSSKKVQVDSHLGTNMLSPLLVYFVLPSAMILLVLWLFMRRLSPQRQVMSFGKSKVRLYAERETRVTFDDVAGVDEAKEELKEVIQFLREPEPFRKVGARIPKGILLVGPPGTGKTLLARAVAGEANVAFLSLTGSDFVEMFAGVGAARVRDLFEQAQKQAPCIVFIDELDALGKVRGSMSLSGAHDEREQTLNQLLAEMDGFDPNVGVVILAATNRPEILDPALLRPGRFDRQVVVDRPDVKGRLAILKVHAAKVKLAADVDLEVIAKRTPGFAGADLENVINEGALLAGRRRMEAVTMKELNEAIERAIAGLEKKSRIMSPREKERTAHHESGHALVALSVPDADPVHRVSIIPRGVAALGYTLSLPAEDRYNLTQSELEDRIAVLLGGRAAELLIYGQVSTGDADDLSKAVGLARRMVRDFGMSPRFGPVSLGSDRRARFLEGIEETSQPYSPDTAREIDSEVENLIKKQDERVARIIKDREKALRAIAARLMENEVIEAEELVKVATENGAPPAPRTTTEPSPLG